MTHLFSKAQLFFLFFLTLFSVHTGYGQGFSYELTGDPVDITGWDIADDSYVDGDEIVLTDPIGTQTGYIYYETPSSLTDCSQFTVTFDFTITNSSSPTADGLAFWYISNPPAGFTSGGGIGLPSDPEGLLLVFDTYNNDGFPDNNPLISFRSMDGTVDYTEGDGEGLIDDELEYQDWVVDEEWHTCVVDYYYGDISVSIDGGAPILSGTISLDGFDGYFGFSAGTGASHAKHRIKNVFISGAPEPEPPLVEDITYCLDAPASPLTADGDNLLWYTSATSTTPLSGAPTPNTSVPGTYTWYVSQQIDGCDLESSRAAITVTVSEPPPAPSVEYKDTYCQGEAFEGFTPVGEGILWYTTATGGTGSSAAPVVNTDVVGEYTFYASQTVAGCESVLRTPVTVTVNEMPVADFSYEILYGCQADTLLFTNSSTEADSWKWEFGDVSLPSYEENPTHVYEDQGDYAVQLTATLQGCSNTVVQFIDTRHPLSASFDVSDDTVCQGSNIVFSNTSIGTSKDGIDPVFFWDFKDGYTATEQNPLHNFATPGAYNVMMVTTDFVPCSDTAYHLVIVDSSATINFTMSDSSICLGDGITLTASYTQNGIDNITWIFSETGSEVVNINPAMRAYDEPGTFNITLQADYRVCADKELTKSILVKPLPIVNLGPDTTICLNGAPIYLASSASVSPGAKWHWNTGDTTAVLKIVHHGQYSVTADLDGCKGSDEIEIFKDCYTDIPNSFTPNNDGVNDYFYPRQLLSKGLIAFSMQVFNRWGQVVFETTSANGRGWDGRFNNKEQPEGVYIYKIDVVMKNAKDEHYTGNVTLLR